jgi:monofunctional biosynthetic peptidoglycan transglycosylase
VKRKGKAWLFKAVIAVFAAFYGWIVLSLVAMKWMNPPATALQIQRRLESWTKKSRYEKRRRYLPLARISPNLQHAVIAAEDGRFYHHHGFDWDQLKDAVQENLEGERVRGASTISQQLVKNLFLTAHGSYVRKGIEFTIVPLEELILGKQRILELYLNEIEWGPGVYGAEAAAEYHYRTSAAKLTREQAARLAAILPSPRRWKPARMNDCAAEILKRMGQLGW